MLLSERAFIEQNGYGYPRPNNQSRAGRMYN
jgi:hypothetical protein